jgi:DMSO reductase anchor subunit
MEGGVAMSIQWSLVMFTVLTGCGGWLLASIAYDEFHAKAESTDLIAAIIGLVLMIAGGVCSVTHLAHPENMLAALGHPTSGIFIEALLVGLCSASTVVYIVVLKKKPTSVARKVFIVLAAFFGVLLSFMAGESYMMPARLNWDTVLLPLGYLGTAMPSGIALYLVIRALRKEEVSKMFSRFLIGAGVIAVVTSATYVIYAGGVADYALLLWGCCVLLGGLLPVVAGTLVQRLPDKLVVLMTLALVGALAGGIAYRCIMWMITSVVDNFFGNVL